MTTASLKPPVSSAGFGGLLRNGFDRPSRTHSMPTEPNTGYDPTLGRKFIFVTGGVMSGLGKGITAASVGRLLKNAGFDVTAVKIDPYLNVDAGTMNPFEHGEVYVLKDGAEVDLDLGNYERFLGEDMTSDHNITTGKSYQSVIEGERAGEYLGKTVQIIPHVTDDIKRRIREAAEGTDICIVEVGGTVGDIESMPFLEALRQFAHEQDDGDILFTHVTLVPYSQNGEQKTKPTQHSVKELRSIGLQPDVLVGRSEDPLDPSTREKIALFCDVPTEAVFSNPDVKDIYRVPLRVEEEGLDEYVMDRLQLTAEAVPQADRSSEWRRLVTKDRTGEIDVALVGKYGLEDAYMSIHESLKHAGIHTGVQINTRWVASDKMAATHTDRLEESDAVVVPGGFGSRGTQGKIEAIRYAREHDVPFLGLCLGFQLAVVEHARHVVGLEGAHSAEIDADTSYPVIDLLPDQETTDDLGGTMRLGVHETAIETGSLAHAVYGDRGCTERHRHRYEVNPEYIDRLQSAGLVFSGQSGRRMEILERGDHPFFLGTQFHPEFRSRPDRASPPFVALVEAVLDSVDTTPGVPV